MTAANLLRATAMVLGAALLVLLAACGGGDPEDHPDQPTPGVNCVATPELCK
jgi:hypothetical protein